MVRRPWPSPPAPAGPPPVPSPAEALRRLHAELLALNEEMIRQLDLERTGAAGADPFVTALIDQHAASAALFREQLVRADSAVALPSGGPT
jgi:hypothetical protein